MLRVESTASNKLINSTAIDDNGIPRTSIGQIVQEQGFEYGIPRQWETITSGGGTVALDNLQRSVILSIPGTSGARATLQEKAATRWRWGHSLSFFLAGVMNYGNTVLSGNTKIRFGFFDDANGAFWQLSASGIAFVFRTSVTGVLQDVVIPQSSFSNDRLDGTGPSRFLADWSKVQRLWVSATSPGGGRGRFGVYGVDRLLQAGQISSINSRTSIPFLQTVSLSHRIEIINEGGSGSGASSQIYSTSAIEEGPTGEETGYVTSCGTGINLKTIPATEYVPLMSIRLRDTYNGFPVRGRVIPLDVQLLNTSNNPAHVVLLENAALAGSVFAPIDPTSITELSTAATALTGGVRLQSGYAAGTTKGVFSAFPAFSNKVYLGRTFANVRDTITVAARGIGGAASLAVEMALRELF